MENVCFLPRRLFWSPDGSRLLINSFENDVIVCNNEDVYLDIKFPGSVSALEWYPLMDIDERASCAFAAATPSYPVRLMDSVDGHVRASYKCTSRDGQLASVCSLAFHGNSIYAGATKCLFECDITRPGRTANVVLRCRGSILTLKDCDSMLVMGLSTGDIAFVDIRSFECPFECSFHEHGVDAIELNGNLMLSSAKLENEVYGVDLRQPSVPFLQFETVRESSRYISISSYNESILIGNEGEEAVVYDVNGTKTRSVGNGPTPLAAFDCSSGRIAYASGVFELIDDNEEEDATYEPKLREMNIID